MKTKNVSALRVAHQRAANGLYRNCSMDDNRVCETQSDLYNPEAIIAIRQDYPKLHAQENTDYSFTNTTTIEPIETTLV